MKEKKIDYRSARLGNSWDFAFFSRSDSKAMAKRVRIVGRWVRPRFHAFSF